MSIELVSEALRASLARKFQIVRDHVTAVARGYKTGLYLYGTGGLGKSFTVCGQLDLLGVSYKLHNSWMTPKGLFQTLLKAPDAIHVLEDMERITKDPDAQGVLRSALWARPGHDRIVTWTTAGDEPKTVAFRGGIIMVSNRPLADLPELRALATRIEVFQLSASDDELTVLMRDIAAAGLRVRGELVLAPEECGRVTEHLLKESRSAGLPLDLRLQQKAFLTDLQHAADCSASHWEDLVSVGIREATCQFRHDVDTASPEAKKARRRNAVRDLLAAGFDTITQERQYRERTGHSQADFYRRKSEVESGDYDESDAPRS